MPLPDANIMQFCVTVVLLLPCNSWRNGIPSRCHEACIQKVLNQRLEGQQQKNSWQSLKMFEDFPQHHQNRAAAQVVMQLQSKWNPYFR